MWKDPVGKLSNKFFFDQIRIFFQIGFFFASTNLNLNAPRISGIFSLKIRHEFDFLQWKLIICLLLSIWIWMSFSRIIPSFDKANSLILILCANASSSAFFVILTIADLSFIFSVKYALKCRQDFDIPLQAHTPGRATPRSSQSLSHIMKHSFFDSVLAYNLKVLQDAARSVYPSKFQDSKLFKVVTNVS